MSSKVNPDERNRHQLNSGSPTETYRCDGCETVYQVAGAEQPTVLCPDCKQVATPHSDLMAKREYQIGYAKYLEARRQATAAMRRFESRDLALARGRFNDAATDFEASVCHFTAAMKEATSHSVADSCDLARKKATCLWQAVEWLGGATYASEQGDESRAARYRSDAEQQLAVASECGDLLNSDELQVTD